MSKSEFTLTKVQDYKKIPGKAEVRLVGENPYCRFAALDEAPIYLQFGKFFYEDGTEVDPKSDDFKRAKAEAEKVSEEKLKKCGYDASKNGRNSVIVSDKK